MENKEDGGGLWLTPGQVFWGERKGYQAGDYEI